MTKPDFSTMTGPALVSQYNEMFLTLTDINPEAAAQYTTVKRFGDRGAGIARCEKLHAEIAEAVAKTAGDTGGMAPAPEAPGRQPESGEFFDSKDTPAPAGETAAPAAQPEADVSSTESEDEMVKRRQSATKGRKGSGRAKATGGTTIRELTEEYNSIVKGMSAAAKKEHPWAKHHTSFFESRDKAKVQLARLKKAVG